MRSPCARGRAARRNHRRWWPRRWRDAVAVLAVILVSGLAGGCAFGKGAKPGDETKAPPDTPAALRQDVDRLRADLAELRTRVETVQRTGTEHADRVALETRAEFDAVQKAIEASSRHDLQRQVEVLDAQARRIDLLERRAAELGQALRRIEVSLAALESQVERILDGSSPAPRDGGRGASSKRSPAASPGPRAAEGSPPAPPTPEAPMSGAAAGAGLLPPAMLGPSRNVKSSMPPAVAKANSADQPRAAEALPEAKRTDVSGETKAAPPAPPAAEDASRVAKAAPPSTAVKPTAPEGPAGPSRSTKAGTASVTPTPGSTPARALFDRAMESWNKGEQGQAVLDFEELVHAFPSDPLAASAQFRIGEAYYTARDFERAALEYRKAVELAPKGKDTPRALLHLGLAYRAQKREADARQAWSQLIRDFPESDATAEARRALRGH